MSVSPLHIESMPALLVWPERNSISNFDELAKELGLKSVTITDVENIAFRRKHHITLIYKKGVLEVSPMLELDVIALSDFPTTPHVLLLKTANGWELRDENNTIVPISALRAAGDYFNFYARNDEFRRLFPNVEV